VRVVMFVHNTVARGTFDRAHSLGRNLVKNGHEVTLFAGASHRARARRCLIDGVEVIEGFDPLPARARESGLSPFDLLNRIYRVRRNRCDLIHCFDHRPTVFLPALLLARRHGTPCIFDWADLWGFEGIAAERGRLARVLLGTADHLLEDRVRRRANSLTVINGALQQRAQERFAAPIHLLPVGASSDLIKPLPKKEMRRRFNLPEDAPIAVHTGLAPYDIPYLAHAFVEVARRRPGALLVMAGRRFPTLESIIGRAGCSNQLVRLGMLDRTRLSQIMACADVLLLPYTNSSVNVYRYPNKLGDYLCAGRPIVTNRTGDLGRLVTQERVGLATDDTAQSFAGAIQQLFDDPILAQEMGDRGRALAESKLDWRFLAAGLERFYDETIRGCG
jgi:glycosyltransferase involved in cell wall biosynthesis